jgi:acetyl esterase
MPVNAQARAILDLLEKRGGKPAEESSPAQVRAGDWAWLEFMGHPEPVAQVRDTYIGGPSAEIHIRIYSPDRADAAPSPCLVYFPGGGWTSGNIDLADRPNRSLANALGCVLVAVNYQKAPEHRYPTALNDCYAAYLWTVQHAPELGIDPGLVGVGGDSAGGNLAATVSLKSRDEGGIQPAFQVLIYPAVDPDMDYPSARDNAEGYALTTAAMRWFWNNYAPDPADRADPLAAPVHVADLAGLPPAIVVTAEYDPLRDEAEAYADRLAEAGVPVLRHRYDGTIHGFLWMKTALVDDFTLLMADLAEDVAALLGDRES